MTKIYIKTCIDCGRNFKAYSDSALRCYECKREVARARSRAVMAKLRREKQYAKPRNTKPTKTLSEIMRELAAYNKEHGTNLTYGQYVIKVEGK